MSKKVTVIVGEGEFQRVGREAKKAAQRALLLAALKRHDWNLTRAGRSIGLYTIGVVLRAIRDLGLEAEVQQARDTGLIKYGRPKLAGDE